jgi:phosphate transport system substrate-binding protein
MRITRNAQQAIGLTVLVAVVAGCSGDDEPAGSVSPASPSTITVDGSSTVYRISVAARDAFKSVDPAVAVVVDYHGTGAGFNRYFEGEVDIIDASRAAKSGEESRAQSQGIEWTRFLVGYDGITLVKNPKNDFVKSLTTEQLKALWAPASKISTWKDLDPAWPARKIVLYSPDNDSGTFEFFTEAIVGEAKSQREDVQQSSDDNFLVIGVKNDTDGLGYFGYAYFAANQGGLRAVAVQKGATAEPVLPSVETILDKTYSPLSRPLFIYVKNSAVRRPEVGRFVRHYLENVENFAVKGGYAPPSAEDKAANMKSLTQVLSGDGAKSEKPVQAAK